MKLTYVTSLISTLALTIVRAEDDQAILSALRSAEIIPNILPVFDPSTDLEVTYVNRAMNFGTEHWLSVNIPGKNVAAGNSTGTPYLAPRPFPGCGRKRFVYVLAKQQSNMPNLSVPAARPNFNIADFAKANNMEIIGANYFQVEAQPGATCTIPGAATSTTSTTANSYKTTSTTTTPNDYKTTSTTTTTSDYYRVTEKVVTVSKCRN
ncbi:hypothetical protein BB561_004405 [Smittium simulii]|uniref:Uncharacterized protein n=1 Tax=Smittium simulii TaxID=133385 RepID=A0A2T9YGK2_9FUNG|nr:hypothetical protein BB561_004405 [Smittium simulii]